MKSFNLESLGNEVTDLIKRQPWFPYDKGTLKFHATKGALLDSTTYRIHFDSSVLVAMTGSDYLSALEEGTDPHDIPHAFGRPLPFGIGGRFDGKFHPGSKKHVGFIKDKSVGAIVQYIQSVYGGRVEVS